MTFKKDRRMQIRRHKITGKHFIYISGADDNDVGLFITPRAEEKRLRLDQFEELEDIEDDECHGLTKSQLEMWRKYEDEMFTRLFPGWENLTVYERKEELRKLKKKV